MMSEGGENFWGWELLEGLILVKRRVVEKMWKIFLGKDWWRIIYINSIIYF
jgi:hypothetical protein